MIFFLKSLDRLDSSLIITNTMSYQDYRQRGKISSNTIILCAILGIIAIVIITVATLNANTVYFFTPQEAKDQAQSVSGKVIRVGGMVKVGSVHTDYNYQKSQFVLSNLKNTNIDVVYYGLLPDLFKEGQGVVVEGKISQDGASFSANKLMVKHSQEYQLPDSQHPSINTQLLQKSLFEN